MSDPGQKKQPENLELDDLDIEKETVRDLTNEEMDRVAGGNRLTGRGQALTESCTEPPTQMTI